MKILALDMGDRWIGTAISDPLGMLARPYETVDIRSLESFLQKTILLEGLKTIVAGIPKTLRDTESDQTRKVKADVERLQIAFPAITWILWDERWTSQQASRLKRIKTKEDKLQSHSIAAALILGSYLDYLAFQKSLL
jgi:putative holliday junction resolvase